MRGRFALKSALAKIWHGADNFRIMAPLPPPHRRGIIIAAVLMVIGFLLPSADETDSRAVNRSDPVSQPPLSGQPTGHSPALSSHPPDDIEQQWRSYQVEPGKTLAQLFRDHNLPPADVYAMAQVEGADKPLSALQSGQMVRIRQNVNSVVTGLAIEDNDGRQVLFIRQADGSFIRAR